MEPVAFTLAGHPQGKGRARAFVRAGHVAHYTPEKTRSYESMIRGAAMDAMAGRAPLSGPVEIDLRIEVAIPASWSKRKRTEAEVGVLWPAKTPDLSNVQKAVEDAMNGVVYGDDSQIVRYRRLEKVYSLRPGVTVEVRSVACAA